MSHLIIENVIIIEGATTTMPKIKQSEPRFYTEFGLFFAVYSLILFRFVYNFCLVHKVFVPTKFKQALFGNANKVVAKYVK